MATLMVIWNIIFTVLFLAWMCLTAWIGWKILDSSAKNTQKLITVLMDSVVTSANAARLSSENAQRVVRILEEQLRGHDAE